VTADTDTGILCHEVVSLHCKKCCNKSGIIFRHGLYYWNFSSLLWYWKWPVFSEYIECAIISLHKN